MQYAVRNILMVPFLETVELYAISHQFSIGAGDGAVPPSTYANLTGLLF
jgi:hypothetical protein